MKNGKLFLFLLVYFSIYFIFLVKNAYAYLDPGTGSYILQLIAASLFAGLFLFKNYLNKIKEVIYNLFKRGNRNKSL